MPRFRIARGWAWLWWIGAAELGLLGLEAVPVFQPVPAAVAQARVAATSAVPLLRVSLQPILDFQPFGTTAPPAAPALPAAAAEPLPPAGNLVLQGVLLRDEVAASRVLLSWDGGPARIFAIGDLLPGGGTLSGIAANRIWIDLGDEMRTLGFPDPGAAQPLSVAGAVQGGTGDDVENGASSGASAGAAKPQARSLPQPDLRNLIPGLVADPPDQP